MRVGEWNYYHENGKLHEKVTFSSEGLRNGSYLKANESGIIVEQGYYKDGLPDGKWDYYFPNGGLMRQAGYKGAKLNGETLTYTRRGMVLERASYKDGKKDGKYVKYNEKNGKIEQEIIYTSGKAVTVKVQNGKKL